MTFMTFMTFMTHGNVIFDILEPPAFRKYMKNLNILEKWVRIYTRPIAVTAGINQTKEDT